MYEYSSALVEVGREKKDEIEKKAGYNSYTALYKIILTLTFWQRNLAFKF
jgi:hypothetical protein